MRITHQDRREAFADKAVAFSRQRRAVGHPTRFRHRTIFVRSSLRLKFDLVVTARFSVSCYDYFSD